MNSLSSDGDQTVVIDPVITMSTDFLTACECTSRESNPGLYRGRHRLDSVATKRYFLIDHYPFETSCTKSCTAINTSSTSDPGFTPQKHTYILQKEERRAVFESMEANYKQRGRFTSSVKLVMSLHQASNPSSSTVHYDSSVNPSSSSSVASVRRQNDGNLDHPRYIYNGDESIDARAASYISSVRQRFRLE
ncbi:hypothetical protein POTOM_049602 [Populus tomentosa]|uniref:Uncharacterized protein n=3 Tax=Populus TaxID=3689 RepID=A0A8X8CAM5_POPTO|nr:hypothetical protein POTOM_049602 [Populus tomentosa]